MSLSVTAKYIGARQNVSGHFRHLAKLTVTGLAVPTGTWVKSTAYSVGNMVTDGTNIEIVSVAGTSGTTTPSWSGTVGNNTTDNTVTWLNIGVNAEAVPHGLTAGYPGGVITPQEVIVNPTSAGGFHQTLPADTTNIYAAIDGAGATCEFDVWY